MTELDPTDFAGQEAARDARIRREKLIADQRDDDFKWLMQSQRGRRLMYWLLGASGVFRSTYAQPASAAGFMAIAMAHAEGRKDIGYMLMGQINRICPDLYTKMMKENRNG